MPEVARGMLGCYRCGHVWRPARSASPTICPRCKSRFWDAPVLRSIRRGHRNGIPEILGPYREEVLKAVRRRGFGHVRVFGSVRRSEAGPTSDVDLLVERLPGASLLDRAALELDLEAILRRPVDVVPEEALHWLARPQVLFEAVAL